jgi:hypothetical protein
MTQYLPPVAPARSAMTDKQINRMAFRIGLLQRHGWSEHRAERWADRLHQRDTDKDDRRLCAECKNLLSGWRCEKRGAVAVDVLQRCPTFQWMTP